MRFHIHRNVAAAGGVALLAIASSARAQQQLDTNPPAPNVLLLLDNSGSMERMIDGNLPEADGNACNYDMTGKAIPSAVAPQPNRWGNVLQALTGTFENSAYSCIQMSRASGGQFTNEYQIHGTKPYDADYYLDYHRPVLLDTSTSPPTACVVAPGSLPGAAPGTGVGPTGAGSGNNGPGPGRPPPTSRPTGSSCGPSRRPASPRTRPPAPAVSFRTSSTPRTSTRTAPSPRRRALMRFGLMTFDQDPSPGIGVTIGAIPPSSATASSIRSRRRTARSPGCGATSSGGTPAPPPRTTANPTTATFSRRSRSARATRRRRRGKGA